MGSAGGARADSGEANRTRGRLEDIYTERYSERTSLYQSAPETHLVPSLKTVTLALAAERYDVKVTEPQNFLGLKGEQLALSGYRVAPYVAVSLKRIGLGFSAETGVRHAVYDLSFNRSNGARRQTSDVDYKAIGIYAYLLPFESKGDMPVLASVIGGAIAYNVTHNVTPLNNTAEASQGRTKFRYNVDELVIGSLVEVRPLKFFSLLPWVNYTYVDAHDPIAQADDARAGNGGQQNVAGYFSGDVGMFWLAKPRLNFGLDLVLKTHGFAIHLGQAFGFLVSPGDTDQITDRTLSLSVSQDLKGD